MVTIDGWILLGCAAAICTMLGFFPQIIKVMRTRSARDVSIGTILQIGAGACLWVLYGWHLKDWIIISANAVTLASLLLLLGLYLRYR